jgi:adenylate cyclase
MTEERAKRKLSGILSADAVGYSRLMQEDEASTIRNLEDNKKLMSELIEQFKGRVVDAPGDNLLAEFSSVVDATECAVKIQQELKAKNAELPGNRKMDFRIGVNLGDVVEEADRIYGEGVNIAARIEGIAEPGGVCISKTTYEHIKNKLGFGYEYLGEYSVKNIAEPVRVYRILMEPEAAGKVIGEKKPKRMKWLWAASGTIVLIILVVGTIAIWNYYFLPSYEPASVEKMAFPLPEKPSIAVLPFDNMSDDPEQDYFSDGLTEQLISALSKVEYLFVISRNSTFTYKGKPVKVKQVAEELGVRYVLEGSLRKAEDRLRITVQLIDALKGHHLWSESYDRELKDIFDLQDEITMKVVTAMRVKLTAGEQARAFGKGTKNLKAYLKRLEAVELYYLIKKEANVRAKQLLEEAIALDPEFGDAYSFLAYCHINDALYGWSKSPPKSIKRAFELAQKAQSLDDSLPQPHGIKSITYVFQTKYEEAIAEAQQAVEIYPNGAMFIWNLGWILRCAGRPEEGIPLMEKSIRLNPIPTYMVFDTLGRAYFLAGNYEKAIAAYKTAVKLDPDQRDAHVGLAATYAVLGREGEARTEVSEILRIEPSFSIKKYEKFMFFQLGLEPEIEGLRKAGFPEHPPLKLPDKPSIAVLPFDNMSDDPGQEYFSDGMTDDLITDLSKISGLLVISRNSSFTYKGQPVKIKQVAKELNVRYVLEGSVRKVGDKLRINAQLIDATTDHHLWAERYDGQVDDVFALQDKITRKIISALAVKLTGGEQEKLARKGTKNIAAYDAFLRGWEHYLRRTPDGFKRALAEFKTAIKLDPNYGRAYAGLAMVYYYGPDLFNWNKEMSTETMPRQRAGKYLELALHDPTSLAHVVASLFALHRRHYEEAFTHAELAIAMEPNNSEVNLNMAKVLVFLGRHKEAIDYVKKSMRLDPINTDLSLRILGMAYLYMGQFEKAADLIEEGRALNPENKHLLAPLAVAYGHLGRHQEGREVFEDWQKYLGFFPDLKFVMVYYPSMKMKDADLFADGLLKAGIEGQPSGYYKLNKENRLTGDELKKMYSDRDITITYECFGMKYKFDYKADGGVYFKFFGSGRSRIKGDMRCILWDSLKDLNAEHCSEVYRNSEGTPELNNEYLSVTDTGICAFSLPE